MFVYCMQRYCIKIDAMFLISGLDDRDCWNQFTSSFQQSHAHAVFSGNEDQIFSFQNILVFYKLYNSMKGEQKVDVV